MIHYPTEETYYVAYNEATATYHAGTVQPNQCMDTGMPVVLSGVTPEEVEHIARQLPFVPLIDSETTAEGTTRATLTLPLDCINPDAPTHWPFALRMSKQWMGRLNFFLSESVYKINDDIGWAGYKNIFGDGLAPAKIVFDRIGDAMTTLTSSDPDWLLVEEIASEALPTMTPRETPEGYQITAYFSDTLIEHIFNPPNAQLAAMAQGITLELP